MINELPPHQCEQLAARVTGLEELLTHFERSVGQLDGVLRQVQTRLDTMERQLANLTKTVHGLADATLADPPGEDERPPHY